jgi:acetyl esterase/lipase
MSILKLLVAVLLMTITKAAVAAEQVKDIPSPQLLWSDKAPGSTGESDEDKPAVYQFPAEKDSSTGASFLVVPGGGFSTRCIDFEGVLIARWLNAHGINAYILRYRIRPIYGMKESLVDAQRGIQFLRSHASQLGISPERIGIIGFSAGAELASSASMHMLAGQTGSVDAVERVSSRPDFAVLAYGSSSAANIPGNSLSAVPPTFMFCTAEDMSHLTGMAALYSALRRARVPAEAHFFAAGEHGVSFAQGDPTLGLWPDLMLNWLRGNGMLTSLPRVALKGIVTLDGVPLARGTVIFLPDDVKNGIPTVGYVFNTGPVRGQFNIPADHGPTAGRYHIEIRQDANRWVSNSQDPLQVKMNQKAREGSLSDADRKEWMAATRARDLSPSIDAQHVYRRAKPGDAAEIVVDVPSTGDDHMAFNIVTK